MKTKLLLLVIVIFLIGVFICCDNQWVIDITDPLFTDKDDHGHFSPGGEMMNITGGTFSMGHTVILGASPVHSVTVNGFKVSKYEVTQEQWEAVMGNNPSYFQGAGNLPDAGEIQVKRPVDQVSWYDVIAFCNKLSVKEGLVPVYTVSGITDWGTLAYSSIPTTNNPTWNAATANWSANGYRLPTEAEWECACRAGSTADYSPAWDGTTIASAPGWYNGNSNFKIHQVGLKAANAFGLYDMHGNVHEWCWDWYDLSYYASSPGNNPTGPLSGTYRVNRGGNYAASGASDMCSAVRNPNDPYSRSNGLGFRLVRQ